MSSQPKLYGNRVYEGWNIGAVSIKRVRLHDDGAVYTKICKHGGDPERAARELLEHDTARTPDGVVVTGPQSSAIFNLPYLTESVCIEAALQHLQLKPDLVLSLGGESFVVYCLADGIVRNMRSSNRCAAGSGEFLVQQFGRMNLDLDSGIQAAKHGQRIKLATRCSVHCKSDATHKLNKGECTPADIALSLIADLAAKIAGLVESANWPQEHILLAGGLNKNEVLVSKLRHLLPGSQVDLLEESLYLEAYGAAIAAKETAHQVKIPPAEWINAQPSLKFSVRPPLSQFTDKVRCISDCGDVIPQAGKELILGVDAGSTTTKAVLLDRKTGQILADCYLRTHGNPVRATHECLLELKKRLAETGLSPSNNFRILQAAVTGSGRDLVSVYLDNCLSFNEILAHARAAREAAPEVDTLFELGGQDAKFVALESGIPVDYSMNDGCSAGTGSFLEEAAASDMQVPIQEIGAAALSGAQPTAFGERCAAFINSEVRSALQQGVPHADVLAGLVYAITDNYLARVVGARRIGQTILLQGGVALNSALAPAVAARTGMNVLVPSRPELMGCVGAAQMASDLLDAGMTKELNRELDSFGKIQMEVKNTFTCKTCENNCEIKRIALGDQVYPFGGLCSKWEMQRRPKELRHAEGEDLVVMRNDLMFQIYAPPPPVEPRGRIGLPLALSTYELYPLYAKLLTELDYDVVLSRPGKGNLKTYAPICYPGEIMHAAIDDLINMGVDYIFLPYLREFDIPAGHDHAYTCPVVQDIPGIIKSIFPEKAAKILTPEIGLSYHLLTTSKKEIVGMAKLLGVSANQARKAWRSALALQKEFEIAYQRAIQTKLTQQTGPTVILVGRPYAALASDVNLSVPRKIASRGYRVIPSDGLPFIPPENNRNIWHFTQRTLAAIDYAQKHEECYICVLSCFSCGPDAVVQHRLRHELEGVPFCFLEIDSHTAHAGIETRIGAFLDIIEERRRSRPTPPSAKTRKHHAHLKQNGKEMFVIDSEGQRLGLDHERVTHVLLADLPWITAQMFTSFYSTLGWEVITTPDMNYDILQKARKVCSGRECLPFLAMMGNVVAHLDSRPEGEFTIFHLLDQEGPCQNGNWYDIFPIIVKELGQENAVAAWPTMSNGYMEGGEKAAAIIAASNILGDLLGEVRSSLRCAAQDVESALKILDEQERTLLKEGCRGIIAAERQLRRTAQCLANIPLRHRPQDLSKVLLFGGIGHIFIDKPLQRFFEEKGILTKTNDISEFISLLESEWLGRSGFAHGHTRPEEQYSLAIIIRDLVMGSFRCNSLRALRARIHCQAVEWLEKRWRGIMAGSGLLFSQHIPFRKLLQESHDMISRNGYTEAPCTIGRYFTSLNANGFDGYVNIGAFSCAPANSASAVINVLSKHSNIPYATIEADGTVITPSQIRQLETVAAQCLRRNVSQPHR